MADKTDNETLFHIFITVSFHALAYALSGPLVLL